MAKSRKHTVRIRMGAVHWDIEAPGLLINLRTLDTEQRRRAMFEVVKFVRIRRDEARAAA